MEKILKQIKALNKAVAFGVYASLHNHAGKLWYVGHRSLCIAVPLCEANPDYEGKIAIIDESTKEYTLDAILGDARSSREDAPKWWVQSRDLPKGWAIPDVAYKCLPICSTDKLRPAFMCVNFRGTIAEATDGHILLEINLPEPFPYDCSAMFYAKAFTAFGKQSWHMVSNLVAVAEDGTMMYAVDERYPDTKAVWPTVLPYIELPINGLKAMCNAVIKDRPAKAISVAWFTTDKGSLVGNGEPDRKSKEDETGTLPMVTGTKYETVLTTGLTTDITTAFNPSYMVSILDALADGSTETVKLRYKAPNRALYLSVNDTARALLMPVLAK